MVRRRDRYNPSGPSSKPRWLIVWDMHFQLLDSTELAPYTDPVQVLAQAVEQWRSQGWVIESDARYGSFFCHRAGVRRLIAISAADPMLPTGGGPSWYESCPTCGE
jgi:hypothetical protein